jgi:hypothetical protein
LNYNKNHLLFYPKVTNGYNKIKNHFVISIKKVFSLQQLLTTNLTKITDCLQQIVHHLTYVFCRETIVGPKKEGPLNRRGSEAGRPIAGARSVAGYKAFSISKPTCIFTGRFKGGNGGKGKRAGIAGLRQIQP